MTETHPDPATPASGPDPNSPAAGADAPAPPGYLEDKQAFRNRVKRIEGQVRGIGRMIEEDTYCIDILTQISAATAALHSVSVELLREHMGHCVVSAAQESPEAAAAKVDEATAAIRRLIKS